jgi:hypothetical protein
MGSWFDAEAIAGIAQHYGESKITIGAHTWRSSMKATGLYKVVKCI